MSAQFEQATKNLLARINYDPNDRETIEQFLEAFAEHVVWNTTPADGSTILEFEGKTCEEIAKLIPDMERDD